MTRQHEQHNNPEHPITTEAVKRVLDLGRLLLAVLTPEELEELAEMVNGLSEEELDACLRVGQRD